MTPRCPICRALKGRHAPACPELARIKYDRARTLKNFGIDNNTTRRK